MTFVSPLAFWFFLAGLAIVALYLLRRPARPVPVSSLTLWTSLSGAGSRRFGLRLRRPISLLLQLLLLSLIVFALAEPIRNGTRRERRTFVLLIDRSPSMGMAEGDDTRLEEAKTLALMVIDRMGPADQAVILAADSLEPLQRLTSEPDQLRAAIGRLRATEAYSDLARTLPAVRAMASHWESATLFLISDGAEPGAADALAEAEVRFMPVGSGSDRYVAPAPARPKTGRPLAVRIVADKPVPSSLLRLFRALPAYLDPDRIVTTAEEPSIETTDRYPTLTVYYETRPERAVPPGSYFFLNPTDQGALPYRLGSAKDSWEKAAEEPLQLGIDFSLLSGLEEARPNRSRHARAILSSSAGPIISAKLEGPVGYLQVGFSGTGTNFHHLIAYPRLLHWAVRRVYERENGLPVAGGQPAPTTINREGVVGPLSAAADPLPAKGGSRSNPSEHLWAALALGALLLSLLEWILYQRRISE